MKKKPNVMLVVIDTLRAQSMSCYRYSLKTSPAMDKYAQEGTRFNWTFSESPPTQPGFTAILTGTNPIVNNIVSHFLFKDCINGWREKAPQITRGVKMLPQLMRENGYKTYAVDNLITMRHHFYWGYDEYLYSSVVKGKDRSIRVTADDINGNLLPLLKRIKNENFFLFVHYWDPHGPYVPPEKFQKFMTTKKTEEEMLKEMVFQGKDLSWEDFVRSESEKENLEVRAKYDGEIAYVDDRLDQVFKLMQKLGLDKNTVVIIISDHGESFGIHNTMGHAGLHDTVIRVPLIFHGSGIPVGKVINALARQVDVVPTVLDFTGIDFKEPYPLSGMSLKPLIMGETSETVEAIYAAECTQQKTRAIRTKKWKFIKAMEDESRVDGLPSKELYDLENDPWEEKNLVKQKPDVAQDLEKKMDAWVKEECQKVGRERDIMLITPRGVNKEQYKDPSQYDFQTKAFK
ncbi:sulfatase [Patescibacteria group bacterium]|nr:sulfatase [Patescibacteria group bacterium]